MSQLFDQSWSVERGIKTLVQANASLWTHIGGRFYEGAVPKGSTTRQAVKVCVMRAVPLPGLGLQGNLLTYAPPVASGIQFEDLTGLSTYDKPKGAWSVYDYEVVVQAETESFGDVAADAHLIYTALNGQTYTTDDNYIYYSVVASVRRRRVRDGRIVKELGHHIRALVRDNNALFVGAREFALSIDPDGGGQINLRPYTYSCKLTMLEASYYNATPLYDFWAAWDVEGYLIHDTNMERLIRSVGPSFIQVLLYGYHGSTAGYFRIKANVASTEHLEVVHGSDAPPGLGPSTMGRWSARFVCLYTNLAFDTY